MKKTMLLLLATCIAGTVLAVDVVMNLKLKGWEAEDSSKTSKISQYGYLIIEDVNVDTNVYEGTVIFLEREWVANKDNPGKGKGKGKGKGRGQWEWTYDKQSADVYIIDGQGSASGIMVDLGYARFAGVGKSIMQGNGKVSQIIVSAGHGVFIAAEFSEDEVVVPTNLPAFVVESEGEIETIAAGKMSARLNKKLTDFDSDTNAVDRVEAWLEDAGYSNSADEDDED